MISCTSNSLIEDLEPISALDRLQTLNLAYTKVKNIEHLSELREMNELNLSHTDVNDISPVRFLPLKKLDISYTQITKLLPLYAKLVNKTIDAIKMEETQIEDMDSIELTGYTLSNITHLLKYTMKKYLF